MEINSHRVGALFILANVLQVESLTGTWLLLLGRIGVRDQRFPSLVFGQDLFLPRNLGYAHSRVAAIGWNRFNRVGEQPELVGNGDPDPCLAEVDPEDALLKAQFAHCKRGGSLPTRFFTFSAW